MRRSEGQKHETSVFNNGADYDVNPQLSAIKQGFYKDARNMAIRKSNQNADAPEKIKGEEILYSTGVEAHYICLLAVEINGHVVEIWACQSNDTFMRIDGTIMVKSPNFDITFDHPLQKDINQACIGGELFITD